MKYHLEDWIPSIILFTLAVVGIIIFHEEGGAELSVSMEMKDKELPDKAHQHQSWQTDIIEVEGRRFVVVSRGTSPHIAVCPLDDPMESP